MHQIRSFLISLLIPGVSLSVGMLVAQEVPFMASFPTRPKADPAALARGKDLYKINCAYCHGEDARGGENGGNNLLRTDVIIKDKNGELLRQFLLNPSGSDHVAAREGVLKFSFTSDQASDIAAFIHDFRLSSRDPGRMRPKPLGECRAGFREDDIQTLRVHLDQTTLAPGARRPGQIRRPRLRQGGKHEC